MKWLSFISIFCVLVAFANQTPKKLVRVAVIDTGLDVEDPRFKYSICDYKDFTDTGIKDTNGHGTHIAGLIQKYAQDKNYCFIILKYYKEKTTPEQNKIALINAYLYLADIKPDVVNFSSTGQGKINEEYNTIKYLNTTKFFVAAGNEHQDIDTHPFYPASYDLSNITTVGNLNGVNPESTSNYGDKVTVWEQGTNILSTLPCNISSSCTGYMTGTSQATAITTGKYIYDHY